MIEDGAVPRGRVVERAFREREDWAIRRVMEQAARFEATINGVASDGLIVQVAEAIRRADGKNLRIRIEENLPLAHRTSTACSSAVSVNQTPDASASAGDSSIISTIRRAGRGSEASLAADVDTAVATRESEHRQLTRRSPEDFFWNAFQFVGTFSRAALRWSAIPPWFDSRRMLCVGNRQTTHSPYHQ
jgi:hypothetical protein